MKGFERPIRGSKFQEEEKRMCVRLIITASQFCFEKHVSGNKDDHYFDIYFDGCVHV